MRATADALTLRVEAADDDALRRLQDGVGARVRKMFLTISQSSAREGTTIAVMGSFIYWLPMHGSCGVGDEKRYRSAA
jgi:hypothetical protein